MELPEVLENLKRNNGKELQSISNPEFEIGKCVATSPSIFIAVPYQNDDTDKDNTEENWEG